MGLSTEKVATREYIKIITTITVIVLTNLFVLFASREVNLFDSKKWTK